MDYLEEINDPRKPSNRIWHDFQEILVIAAMLSDCDTVEDIAYWAPMKETWLRRFLVLKNSVPPEGTFLSIFRVLDPKPFEIAFRRWVAGAGGALSGTIAVDGKTLRGSGTGGETAIHTVSAFNTELGVVVGQEKIAGKNNEVTAIPELLDALYLKGFLVTIDAMGCHKRIAKTITTKGGDYLLMVKGNQPSLLNAIETTFISHDDAEDVDRQSHAEKSHGRIVGQVASVLRANGTVDRTDWLKCKTIGRIDSIRVVGGKESDFERRYYISSRELSADQLAAAVRAHWGIENRLHWVLDVRFGEDGKPSASTVSRMIQATTILTRTGMNMPANSLMMSECEDIGFASRWTSPSGM